MRDERYFARNRVSDLVRFGLSELSVEPLRGMLRNFANVYEAYARCINRTYDLAKLPTMLTLEATAFGLNLAEATKEETGSFKYTRIAKRKRDDIRLRMTKVECDLPPIHPRTLNNRVSSAVQTILARADKKLTDGLDSVMPSLIVFAWTAFEVLCEDLLEKAIDLRPMWFTPLRGRGSKRRLLAWEAMSLRGKTSTHSHGSFGIAKREQLSYSTIKGIRDAYWLAFCVDSRGIDRLIADRKIDTLHAIRNVSVHNGGVVDRVFLNRVAGLPEFTKAGIGDPLQLDFGMVKNLVQPVLARGIKLIAAVNKWVVEHPDGKAPMSPTTT